MPYRPVDKGGKVVPLVSGAFVEASKEKGATEFMSGGAMIDAIEEALQPIRNSLQADGFALKVDGFKEGVVSVVVLAGPEACMECLVPQEHMKLRIEDRLKGLVQSVPVS